MALTPDDVSRIALLARLELQAPEKAAMLQQLNEFFTIVERMKAIDTSGVVTPNAAIARRSHTT